MFWNHKRHPLLLRFLLWVVFPALVTALYAGWSLRQTLPVEAGVIETSVGAPVVIDRDAQGVPFVRARRDRDAFFAIGYLHAQDRMWQLELQRRIASGRLSEVFGREALDQDIWFRTLDLEGSARSAWPALSADAQASLQAYTDGINSWLDSGAALPVEFRLLGIKPGRRTVYDSLAWIKVFALDLGGNYRREIERLLVSDVLGPQRYQALFPGASVDTAVATAMRPDRQRRFAKWATFQRSMESDLQIGGRAVGSNAWAVSGRNTRDGRALLANDPHLGLQIPSLWYMASIRGDRIDATGATLVGLPLVIFGRNDRIAWGGTNLMADVQDLYVEQTRPDDRSRYDLGGRWVPFDTRDEYIQVRQDFPAFLRSPFQPVRLRVRRSVHGPVVSDMFDVFDEPATLRWTALDAGDTSYEAFFRLDYARDWPSFREALSHHVAPALNVLYADDAGHIGYAAAGRVPVRASGDGTFPVAGWDAANAWTGWIPADRLPAVFDPPSGFLASANNKPVGDDYPYLITKDWAPSARVDRITQLLTSRLAGGRRVDAVAMQQMQADLQSEPARRLLAILLRHAPSNDQQRRAYGFLRPWSGAMTRDSQAATIFNVWVAKLKHEVLDDDLRGPWGHQKETRYVKGVIDDIDLDTLGRLLTDPAGRWCDDHATPDVETCDDAMDGSLNDALWEVLKTTGDTSMKQWAWGDVHRTQYRHVPFSDVNVLRLAFERRIASGGSSDVIDVASYSYDKAGGYVQTFGAGMRQVIAPGRAGTDHWYMNSTGQSGNPVSAHYDDMVEGFRDVRYRTFVAPRDASRRLVLMPSKGTRR